MKGQYFSFDSIVATVIMVIAFTSLIAYWYGAQSVIDSRTSSSYDDAIRIADSLFSPGEPAGWPNAQIPAIKQLGLANGFGNELNRTKIQKLYQIVNPSGTLNQANYAAMGRILRAQNYYILIETVDMPQGGVMSYGIGNSNFANAREVAIATRGAAINAGGNKMLAARVKVYVWKN